MNLITTVKLIDLFGIFKQYQLQRSWANNELQHYTEDIKNCFVKMDI